MPPLPCMEADNGGDGEKALQLCGICTQQIVNIMVIQQDDHMIRIIILPVLHVVYEILVFYRFLRPHHDVPFLNPFDLIEDDIRFRRNNAGNIGGSGINSE